MGLLVTFDLVIALTDSAARGVAFSRLAAARGWSASGAEVHADGDAHDKAARRQATAAGLTAPTEAHGGGEEDDDPGHSSYAGSGHERQVGAAFCC